LLTILEEEKHYFERLKNIQTFKLVSSYSKFSCCNVVFRFVDAFNCKNG